VKIKPLCVSFSLVLITSAINGWEAYFDKSFEKATGREGKFSRYFLRPLHWGSLKLWSASQTLPDEHLRAGVRLSTIIYFWAVMTFLLVATIYIIVALVILIIIMAIIGWFLSQGRQSEERTSRESTYTPPKRSVGSWFATECTYCGSKEHASSDCPHGILSTECTYCGSKNHASADCPHGMFSTKCTYCGSTDHVSDNCPHGMFSTECTYCGSQEHASADCPHGLFVHRMLQLREQKSCHPGLPTLTEPAPRKLPLSIQHGRNG